VPLDELEEHRGPVADRLGEDLQQVAVLVAVDEDAAGPQLTDGNAHRADPGAQLWIGVVRVGGGEELDAALPQAVHGRQDVAGGERQVLHAGPAVELQVLVDLRLPPAGRRLVQRELDPVVAVGDDLAHQRRVLGGDVVADELGHVREPHDPVVEVHPFVHPAELHVADDVVQRHEEPLAAAGAGARHVAGQVRTGVPGPVDQRVPGLPVRGDRRGPHRAVGVGEVAGLLEDGRALSAGVRDAPVDVGHLERHVDHAVAVPPVVAGQRAVRAGCALDHEPGRAAAQHVGVVVTVPGLRAGVRDKPHAERELVEQCRLGGVAGRPHDRVPAGHRERVAPGVVVHQAEKGPELGVGRGVIGRGVIGHRVIGHRVSGSHHGVFSLAR